MNVFGGDANDKPQVIVVDYSGEQVLVRGPNDGLLGYIIPENKSQNSEWRSDDEGVFVQWRFDGRCFYLRNDRFGFRPFYWADVGKCVYFSSTLTGLLNEGLQVTLNFAGIGSFLYSGSYLGEETPFNEIRSLLPSTKIVISPRNFSISDEMPISPNSQEQPQDKLVDRYNELFESSLERCLSVIDHSSNFTVTTSGGKDSRRILFGLVNRRRSPEEIVTAKCVPWILLNDHEIATQLSTALNIRCKVIEQNKLTFCDVVENIRETNFLSDEHLWYRPVSQYLVENYKFIFDGLAGDVLLGKPFVTAKRLKLAKQFAFDELSEDLAPPFLSKLISPGLMQYLNRDDTLHRVSKELKKLSAFDDVIGSYYFLNRIRTKTGLMPLCYLRSRIALFPFLSREIVDFTRSIPVEYFLEDKFRTETLYKMSPIGGSIDYGIKPSWKPRSLFESRIVLSKIVTGALQQISGSDRRFAKEVVDVKWVVPRLLRLLVDPYYGQEGMSALTQAVYLTTLSKTVSCSSVSNA